ncbi:hypothetical protein VM1G_03286 [Cytospora mali]|uniref:Uncharacterized protein n=1 Tax=Cytospora mali TaxID=578113 RepID=A0A194VVD5_CYTMA|nr:hypothetical protein VM1G_03286 [Valsa mali]
MVTSDSGFLVMMPPRNNDPTSPGAVPTSSRSHPESPNPESNVWVDVQPPSTPPGLQGQQRTSTSSIWSVISQAAGAKEEYNPYYIPTKPDTTPRAGSLTDTTDNDNDNDTNHEPYRPATATTQTDTAHPNRNSNNSNNTSQPPLCTYREPAHQGHTAQQQHQHQPWTWKTLLLVEDKADELDLGFNNCAAITLVEQDIASPAALRAKVLAALERMALHAGRPGCVREWVESGPELEICIAWSLVGATSTGAGAGDRGQEGHEDFVGWSRTHGTCVLSPVCLELVLDEEGDEEEDRVMEEACWLRENMEIAASGLGEALLVARVISCSTGYDDDYDDEEHYDEYDDE